MNGCFPPLLYEVLDLILHKPRQFQADSCFQAVVHHTILTARYLQQPVLLDWYSQYVYELILWARLDSNQDDGIMSRAF